MDLHILDVTRIEPKFKHPRIFEKFDALAPNEAFIIHNDHDPKPLYYQLIGERGHVFTWDYLENGPDWWRVKIVKKSDQEKEETIGELVAMDFRKAQVFKKLGIDFCCGGKKTLQEVCNAKGLNISEVKELLSTTDMKEQNPSGNYDKWSLEFLTDYIVNTHHQYVRENVPFITELASKVAKVHGEEHPELAQISDIFSRLGKDLTVHLMKEETVLFPYIKELAMSKKQGNNITPRSFGTVSTPTRIMEMEHEQAGENMAAINLLSSHYTLPEGACASYTILYKKLEEFESDLFNHVHLENNILFPKSQELEKELAVR